MRRRGLIYVADLGKLEHTAGFEEPGLHDPEAQKSHYYVDTGLIALSSKLRSPLASSK